MIPNFEASGVLPPFLGANPTKSAEQAPYKVSLDEFVEHFATSKERVNILEGFLNFRIQLKLKGITQGFQWLDGSFVEDVESVRGRPPKDIDIVTFASRPYGLDDIGWRNFILNISLFFDANQSKAKYKCDHYYVDLQINPIALVSQTRYWFGLFSHQRATSLWKGMLEVELADDEKPILSKLLSGGSVSYTHLTLPTKA